MDTNSAPENEAIYTFDVPSGKLKWNNALNTIYGYPASEATGTIEWWVDHIHPDDAMVFSETIDRALNHTIGDWSVQYRFRNATGSYIMVRDHASVMRTEDGEPLRIIGALTPVKASSM